MTEEPIPTGRSSTPFTGKNTDFKNYTETIDEETISSREPRIKFEHYVGRHSFGICLP